MAAGVEAPALRSAEFALQFVDETVELCRHGGDIKHGGLAALVPARQAMRLDPVTAFRIE